MPVVVLGSSGFDLTIRLPRLPRPGETLLGGSLHRGPGGKGATAQSRRRRAGAEVTFLTAFGDDHFGRQIREHDEHEGLDLTYASIVTDQPNQVALIFVGEDGQNLIGVAPAPVVHWVRPRFSNCRSLFSTLRRFFSQVWKSRSRPSSPGFAERRTQA